MFRRFYLRDLSSQRNAVKELGPTSVAQQVACATELLFSLGVVDDVLGNTDL